MRPALHLYHLSLYRRLDRPTRAVVTLYAVICTYIGRIPSRMSSNLRCQIQRIHPSLFYCYLLFSLYLFQFYFCSLSSLKQRLSNNRNYRVGNIRHSPSEPALNMRSISSSRSSSLTRNRPDLTSGQQQPTQQLPPPIKSRFNSIQSPFAPSAFTPIHPAPTTQRNDYVSSVISDRPAGGLDMEDFLPVIN